MASLRTADDSGVDSGSRPRGRGFHVLVIDAVAIVLGAVALFAFLLRFVPAQWNWLVAIATVSPYLMLGAPVAAALFAGRRSWLGVATAAVLTVACVATQLPLYIAQAAPSGRTVVLLQANLKLGGADPATIVRRIRDRHVDIFAAEELTPAERDALRGAGLDRALPYAITDPRVAAGGSGLWSAFPLRDKTVVPTFLFAFVTATVAVPGVTGGLTVGVTHMPGPWPQSAGQWNAGMSALPAELARLSAPGRPVLVAGDFNATPDSAQFRRLLVHGYHDAADQAGAGMTRTFPGNTWFPALIAIDHVLTRGAVARSVHTVHLPGSDHRGLLVTVTIPAS